MRAALRAGEFAGKPAGFCDYLESEKTGLPKSNVLSVDLGGGGSAVVCPSGTEPLLKLYVSAPSAEEAEKIAARLAAQFDL